MLDKAGIHIRRVENGYVTHEYQEDKDWAWKDMDEVCKWLCAKDIETRKREQYEIYCKNAKASGFAPMIFEAWKKNPIIAPIMTTTP